MSDTKVSLPESRVEFSTLEEAIYWAVMIGPAKEIQARLPEALYKQLESHLASAVVIGIVTKTQARNLLTLFKTRSVPCNTLDSIRS